MKAHRSEIRIEIHNCFNTILNVEVDIILFALYEKSINGMLQHLYFIALYNLIGLYNKTARTVS